MPTPYAIERSRELRSRALRSFRGPEASPWRAARWQAAVRAALARLVSDPGEAVAMPDHYLRAIHPDDLRGVRGIALDLAGWAIRREDYEEAHHLARALARLSEFTGGAALTLAEMGAPAVAARAFRNAEGECEGLFIRALDAATDHAAD